MLIRRRFLSLGMRGLVLSGLAALGQNPPHPDIPTSQKPFRWPNGKRAAISLSFDDARPSQIDVGVGLLDQYGIKATFYVLPERVKERLKGWQQVVASGHEIGNHTMTHPCTVNYDWSAGNALENYTLRMMAKEIDDSNLEIQRLLGVTPKTFAYPCGQMSVGRGQQAKSYIPVIAQRFVVGRGPNDDSINDPAFCDLSKVSGTAISGMDCNHMIGLISETVARGRWMIFVGSEINARGKNQVTDASALQGLCQYLRGASTQIWVDTVEHIGRYIRQERLNAGI